MVAIGSRQDSKYYTEFESVFGDPILGMDYWSAHGHGDYILHHTLIAPPANDSMRRTRTLFDRHPIIPTQV